MKNYVLLICFMMTAGMVSAQALKVNSAGLVGVGHGNPLGGLHMINDNSNEHARFWSNTGVTNSSHQVAEFYRYAPGVGNAGFNAGYVADGTDVVYTYLYAPGERDFAMATFDGGIKLPLYLDNIGRVGINDQTNPSQALDVNGSAFKNDGNSAWNFTSDKKTKKNIKKYSKGLKEILSLDPIVWNYNGKAGTNPDGTHVGVIAQEFQKIAPDYVHEFTFSPLELTDSGETDDLNSLRVEKSNSETYLQMNDSPIKYMLINAIKEQQTIIEQKSREIENLEDRINHLESIVSQIVSSNQQKSDNEISIGTDQISSLGQNVPNPFEFSTTISYNIPSSSKNALISIYSLDGQLIKAIKLANTGKGELKLNTTDLGTGTFSYQLSVDGALVDTKKMIHMR